ncbi:L-pipecolate oxidase [Taylorella equigenitalis]|uniref:L-pipecolate oxidase n=1 Tax=Taylorella equigenitalis TaxID=29575 RepID=UPI000415E980|nr:FAD-binding oxidoreductase [Taylorella equigenitalis]ASY38018.1 FAD-binding oxidoreductase [Taylorella equigenitalis]ASY42438.1 FAD-dependent oxidoreductase [Taylorella equigenitalis]KGK34254.1 FAD-dependent oxidoreductase [Taylorella equigenitalis]RBA26821.1 FAD-binding oxidoreductase [Taylorella equigenitalis]
MLEDKNLWPKIVDKSQVESFPKLSTDETTQVCIIGGGYTGLSAAIHLAEKGYSVVLLEANIIGSGGSGRNVGYVNAGTWATPRDLNNFLGETQGEILNKALGDAPSLVWNTIDRFQIDAQDVRVGNLHMGHNAAGEADVDDRYKQFSSRGVDCEVLTGSKCLEYTGTTAIKKALLDRRAGTINPYAYVTGLAKAAKNLGVKIYEHTSVKAIVKSDGKWQVQTESNSVTSEKVVIGTNAYTEGEWTEILKSIYFVGYYQIATEPMSGDPDADKVMPYRTGSWDTRLALSTFRRDKEDRVLLGTVGFHEGKESLYVSWANAVLKKYYPELAPKAKWQYRWSGRFGFTQDHIMRVFEPAPGIVTATAYNGRGITTGTMMGKCFAEYLDTDNREAIPLPFKKMEENSISMRGLRSGLYDAGIAIYHAGQVLKIVS